MIKTDDKSYVAARRACFILYAVATLFVVLAGLGLILGGGVVAINAEYIESLLSGSSAEALSPDAAAFLSFLGAYPYLLIAVGVLILLFGNLVNYAVYKIALGFVAMFADVKIVRDRLIDD